MTKEANSVSRALYGALFQLRSELLRAFQACAKPGDKGRLRRSLSQGACNLQKKLGKYPNEYKCMMINVVIAKYQEINKQNAPGIKKIVRKICRWFSHLF